MSKLAIVLPFAIFLQTGTCPGKKAAPTCGPSQATPVKDDPGIPSPPPIPIALWISASKDTHISFPEPQRNFGLMPLDVSDLVFPSGASGPHAKATFVDFLMPNLPNI